MKDKQWEKESGFTKLTTWTKGVWQVVRVWKTGIGAFYIIEKDGIRFSGYSASVSEALTLAESLGA